MKLFDIIKKRTLAPLKLANTTAWHSPQYIGHYNTNVFESDVVKQAIRSILQEMRKLEPRHIMNNNGRTEVINDSIMWTLMDPNELMTTADFLEKVCYNLLVKNNSYILPVWEGSELVALYPLSPSEVKFVQDLSNTLFIDFSFANGYSSRVRYSDVIHIRYNLGPSEFLGGDVNGEPDIKALQRGVNLNEALLDSVQKSVHSNTVNGFLKYNTYIDEGQAEKALKKFVSQLNNNENGIMLLDQKSEFVPLQKETKLVDNDTLKFVDEKVLRNYGISPKIVSGDFTKEDYESFFQKVLEPIIVSMEQAFTKGLFTREGRTKYGHKITLYTSALNFMTMTEKKEIGTLLSNTGACNTDELRNMFGYAPCEDKELGKMYIQSKNFGSAEFVSQQVKLETDALKELAKTK